MGLIVERGIEAVIFDMDGTLLDSTASVERCWQRLAQAMEIDYETAPFMHGVPSEATIRAILGDGDEDAIRRWTEFHLRLEVDDASDCVPIDGVFELIAALEAANVPWAIATSCERELGEARRLAAGLPRPEIMVVREDYANGKPAPDPFLKAAELLGIDTARTIVVEDAPAGVSSGVASGAFVIAVVATHAAHELEHAHLVVDTLPALRDVLLG